MSERQPSKGTYQERLLDRINTEGFPLELEVDEVFQDAGYTTFQNNYYRDLDTDEQREIDNYVLLSYDRDREALFRPLAVSPHLIVECKKMRESAAVIFHSKKRVATYHDYEGHLYDFPFLIEKKPRSARPLDEFELGFFFDTKVRPHYESFGARIGIGRGVTLGDKKGRDELYTGLMQLVKAQSYDVDRAIKADKEITHTHYPFYFAFLLLVVEGKVYEATRTSGQTKLQQVKHAIAKVSYWPPYSNHALGYLVDVVEKDYLADYLLLIQKDLTSLSAEIQKNRQLATYLMRPRGVERSPATVIP